MDIYGAIKVDERRRIAQTMRKAAAFAIDVASKIVGEITRDEFVRKIAHTSQHFSLLAWAKAIEDGRWSDEPVAPSAEPQGFDDLFEGVEVEADEMAGDDNA